MMHKLVLLSGGFDSAAAAILALEQGHQITTLFIDYGQRNRIAETNAVSNFRSHFVPEIYTHKELYLNVYNPSINPILENGGDENSLGFVSQEGVPFAFLPNRNALFLTVAHSVAFEEGCDSVIFSSVGPDSLYNRDHKGSFHFPDCEPDYGKKLFRLLNKGMPAKPILAEEPFSEITKAEVMLRVEEEVGEHALRWLIDHTVSCYLGSEKRNKWGVGCGHCVACQSREKAYEVFSKQ